MTRIAKFFVLFICFFSFQTAKAEWKKQDVNTLAWFYDVYFVNEKTGWIAGSGGTLLETLDGGKTWEILKKFTDDNIKKVHFFDEKNGWLLCERNIYNRGGNSSSYLLKTTNGGIDWEKTEFTGAGRGRVTKVLFNQYGSGMAFGEGGAFYSILQTEAEWKKNPSPTRYLLLDGVLQNEFNGVVVGAGGTILFTEDGGANWHPANLFGVNSGKFNSVFFINQKSGWTVGNEGKVFQTVSGGKTWREQKSGIAGNLNDIYFVNTAEGWAVGDDGIILYTKTAGNIWEIQNSRSKHKLETIFFNGKKGFAVGFGGTLLTYDKNENAQIGNSKPILQNRNR